MQSLLLYLWLRQACMETLKLDSIGMPHVHSVERAKSQPFMVNSLSWGRGIRKGRLNQSKQCFINPLFYS